MFHQSSLGDQIPIDIYPDIRGLSLAQVLKADPSDATVRVLTVHGNVCGLQSTGLLPDGTYENLGLKCRVLSRRASPFIGDIDLPRAGEWGLICFPNGTDQLPIWIGSVNQDLNSLATGNLYEKISHHDSGVYTRIAADGTTELSHPSGTFVRMGSGVALDPRTRLEDGGYTISPKGKKTQIKRRVPYAIPVKPAITLVIQHSTGTLIEIDATGNVTVTGVGTKQETITGAVTEAYENTKQETVQGNVTENYQQAWSLTVGANGQVTVTGSLVIKADDVTIESSNANPGAHMHLGGSALEDFIAKLAALTEIANTFNNHTHAGVQPGGGTSGAPTTTLSFSPGTHYSENTKAS